MPTRIAIASDHAGTTLKAELAAALATLADVQLVDLGPDAASSQRVDYPDFAEKVTTAMTAGQAALGILVCGTGIGMSISANKVHGIRAALCHTEFEARMARAHNDANVLCLGQRVTGAGLGVEIAKAFIATGFEGGRHAQRLDKVRRIEAGR